eukprot:15271988-Heterocapsa_arctica.AAC.1
MANAESSDAMEGPAPARLDDGPPNSDDPDAPAEQGAALDLPRTALTIATWNAAAVFSSIQSSQIRVRKRWKALHGIFAKSDIVCLQEIHGIEGDTNTLDKTYGGFLHFPSYCDNPAAGGVC